MPRTRVEVINADAAIDLLSKLGLDIKTIQIQSDVAAGYLNDSVAAIAFSTRREFDTEFFRRIFESLHVHIIQNGDHQALPVIHECIAEVVRNSFERGTDCLVVREPSTERALLDKLKDSGFKVYDRGISFSLVKKGHQESIHCQAAEESDMDELVSLSSTSFDRGHFHRDTNIPAGAADAMHGLWVKNLWRDSRANVLVRREQGRIAGFITIRELSESEHIVDLIAVREEFRNSGIGLNLVECALKTVPPGNRVTVSTQIDNQSAVALYRSAGFAETSRYETLHLWRSEKGYSTQ